MAFPFNSLIHLTPGTVTLTTSELEWQAIVRRALCIKCSDIKQRMLRLTLPSTPAHSERILPMTTVCYCQWALGKVIVTRHAWGGNSNFSEKLQIRSRTNVSTRFQSCEGLAKVGIFFTQFQMTIFSFCKWNCNGYHPRSRLEQLPDRFLDGH